MERAAGDHSSCRAILAEDPRVNLVHCLPEVDIGDGYVHLEYAVPVAARSLENCVHVPER